MALKYRVHATIDNVLDCDYSTMDADAAFTDIHAALGGGTTPTAVAFMAKRVEVTAVLTEWIGVSSSRVIRAIGGEQAHNRTYYSKENIARALMGETGSADNLAVENGLATAALISATLKANLTAVVRKVYLMMMGHMNQDEKSNILSNWYKGKYFPWYYIGFTGGFKDALENPATYTTGALIAVLHDVTDVMWDSPRLRFAVTVPAPKCQASVYVYPGPLEVAPIHTVKRPLTNTADFRHQTGTLKEDREIIESARAAGMPIWAGPSFTTARFMEMAFRAGCNVAELEALAWGLFAFWTNEYYTSQTPIHRFHFVMDMANNYNVPYEIFTYPANPP